LEIFSGDCGDLCRDGGFAFVAGRIALWGSGRMTQLYRLLTGEDGSAFCHKVTLALSNGWRLYGEAQYVFDPDSQKMRCAQAVIKDSLKAYNPDRALGEQ
jgi:hypothetical protein